MGVTPLIKGFYGRNRFVGHNKTKPNRANLMLIWPERGPGVEQPPIAANQFKILFENVLCTLLKFLIYIDAPLDIEFQALTNPLATISLKALKSALACFCCSWKLIEI